jgi:hypothetical protein
MRLAATKRLLHKRLPRNRSARIDAAWLRAIWIDLAKREASGSSVDSVTRARQAATQESTVSSGLQQNTPSLNSWYSVGKSAPAGRLSDADWPCTPVPSG